MSYTMRRNIRLKDMHIVPAGTYVERLTLHTYRQGVEYGEHKQTLNRPEHQGGTWYLGNTLKILKEYTN